ncbi:hypothetical protein ACWEO4_46980 [Streptomyces sp. NPDC004393]|uniref:hypothetical protein n=1 Tax=Streptomyces sp. NPDC004533 TaxID=3154278 RepID=UPI0033B7A6BE
MVDDSYAELRRVEHGTVQATVGAEGRTDKTFGSVGDARVRRICQCPGLALQALQQLPAPGGHRMVPLLAQQSGGGPPMPESAPVSMTTLSV